MAGIEDLNIPRKSNILGELKFTEQESDYSGFQSNLLQGMPLLDAIKRLGTDKALELSGLDVGIQNDIKNNLPTEEVAMNFTLPKILEQVSTPNALKQTVLRGEAPE